ncbi:benzoate 1,2-dioxygenase electron transfer component BenC [Paenalcaligenes hominis]|uniref:benzoate 1,2-dioxygenase electron transfer component BenC n=1 Tax=Paenalcaligenes hominis TaxID=643674 RepID=UPI0035265E6A
MSSYQIALNFEDGVTRFIECGSQEKVLDAAYRHRINLPMDCSDGVCGTCKCHAESGEYELIDDYIDEALTETEAQEGLVLTCQMIPHSDCVIRVPVDSNMCKTGIEGFTASVTEVCRYDDAAFELTLAVNDKQPSFLPGQYVNITVPGSEEHRSYSFSSAPGEQAMSFLIKHVPNGLMSGWLEQAKLGQELQVVGPLGSFYLRSVTRPLLFLAGGTGLAPFLSMLEVLAQKGCAQPIQMIYGVTREQDLVLVEQLEAYAERLANFSFITTVVDPESQHPRKGYVTHHLEPTMLYEGDVDVYLCGPPPMVDAVSDYMREQNMTPAQFYYERFIPSV